MVPIKVLIWFTLCDPHFVRVFRKNQNRTKWGLPVLPLYFWYFFDRSNSSASHSDSLISLSYSMPAFSANSFGLFKKRAGKKINNKNQFSSQLSSRRADLKISSYHIEIWIYTYMIFWFPGVEKWKVYKKCNFCIRF